MVINARAAWIAHFDLPGITLPHFLSLVRPQQEWTKSPKLCQHEPSPAGLQAISHQIGRFTMDKALYDRGMAMRRKVLGDEYVDRAVANTHDFNRKFQDMLNEFCWGP